jgi:hypothetical protein
VDDNQQNDEGRAPPSAVGGRSGQPIDSLRSLRRIIGACDAFGA